MAKKITVRALRPVTLYDQNDSENVLYATEKDVKKKTVYSVPDTEFWNHKISSEKLLAIMSAKTPKDKEEDYEED